MPDKVTMSSSSQERAYNKRAGHAMRVLDRETSGDADNMATVYEIRVKPNYKGQADTLVIVKAFDGQQRYVAFHAGPSADEALMSCLERLGTAGLKWRDDRPYEPPAFGLGLSEDA